MFEEMKIENLLFQQVDKPKNFCHLKVINLWLNRYRVNIYTEDFDELENLNKKRITQSYFCIFNEPKNSLEIVRKTNIGLNTL
jgi:hypothetical protein